MNSKASQELHILNYTDLHGHFLSQNRKGAPSDYGLDRLSTYIKRIKKEVQNLLIIENGDAIQGTPLVDLHDSTIPKYNDLEHPLTMVQRELGVHCFIPGNHEFNYGMEQIRKLREESRVPWLAANILKEESGEPFFQPCQAFDFPFGKIGILGLVTDFIPKWEHKDHIQGLRFENILKISQHCIPYLREQCDYLIVVYHGGMEKEPETGQWLSAYRSTENQGYALWETFPEIDLLLMGHQHKMIEALPREGRALAIQPSFFGRALAHITIDFSDKKSTTSHKIINAQDLKPDPKFKELLNPHVECNKRVLETMLGTVDESFLIQDPMTDVWTGKHPIIQWIQDLMCKLTDTKIAAISLLDASLTGLSGDVLLKDILEFYPFPNTLCVLQINGKILKEALEKTATFFMLSEEKDGSRQLVVNPEWKSPRIRSFNYDIWSGIEYEFDISRPIGERVSKLLHEGKPVTDEQELKVTTTSYRAGGAFYDMFSNELIIQEFPARITDLMIQDLLTRHELKIEPVRNFKIVGL